MDVYYPCCGKSICGGCVYSFYVSANEDKCPFCNSNRGGKTEEEEVEEIMKRVEANDVASISLMANHYEHGKHGFQQDQAKAMELYYRAADLCHSKSHYQLGHIYDERGNTKKAKFVPFASWSHTKKILTAFRWRVTPPQCLHHQCPVEYVARVK